MRTAAWQLLCQHAGGLEAMSLRPHLSSLLGCTSTAIFFPIFPLRTMADVQSSSLEIDNYISLLQNMLLASRPDPLHFQCLVTLALLRLARYTFSDESEDLDKSISHSTEALLLPFDTPIEPRFNVIDIMFYLARALLYRSRKLKQSDDAKHAIKYLRYLQDQSLETSDVTLGDIKSFLVWALTARVELGSIDPTRDIWEMATLCREILSSGVSESFLVINTIKALASAMYTAHVPLGQPPPDEAIECLREARIRLPNLEEVPIMLALSLFFRFDWTHSNDDYEEAMLILDEMIADPNEVELATCLAGSLAWCRFSFDSKPEHLAEAIFRVRSRLNAMSSEDPNRYSVMKVLADLEKRRFKEFGVRSGRQEDDAEVVDDSHLAASPKSNLVELPLAMPDRRNPALHIDAICSILKTTDLTNLTNVEKAIEYCRLCLTSPLPDLAFTLLALGHLLYRSFHLTDNIDHLHESITVHRDLIKMPDVPFNFHSIALLLFSCLHSRFELLRDRKDRDEIMELFAIAVTDTSTPVPHRFPTSCLWTHTARNSRHPSTLIAYENAISLMQESLSFAPTLEIQHFRLVSMRDKYEELPLDYASYLVHIGQLEGAIETLERGRGLLCDDNFSSPVTWMEDGRVGGHEAMDPFGRLVVKQRKLVEERGRLISQIRAQPGFDTFLIPPAFDTLRSAAAGGPVILINHSEWRSDIIILLHDSPPSLIPTSNNFYDHAKSLMDRLLAARNKGLDSREYEDALRYVLEQLYDLVGRPVIERLCKLNVPEQSRVWWCPTSVFCSLPLHAMGPIRSDGQSRKPSTQTLNTPSMLLVVQPDAQMPSSLQEMHIVQTVCPSVETLFRESATPISTLERLKHHRFAHISSHGILEIGKPFDAFFRLYKGTRLTLLDIVRSRLPTAEFAFLSACHTAELTKESIANEGLHLAAAVQYSGFRSVVGTMWAMADIDGPVLAGSFYQSVFSERQTGVPYYERTAEALRDAVRGLRRKKNMSLERWEGKAGSRRVLGDGIRRVGSCTTQDALTSIRRSRVTAATVADKFLVTLACLGVLLRGRGGEICMGVATMMNAYEDGGGNVSAQNAQINRSVRHSRAGTKPVRAPGRSSERKSHVIALTLDLSRRCLGLVQHKHYFESFCLGRTRYSHGIQMVLCEQKAYGRCQTAHGPTISIGSTSGLDTKVAC
ncbi:CHAT domain-containing protein [Russula compacta]|nr:CHAT domain-containing protein [Russula compacta]